MDIEMLRDVTLPRFTLKDREMITYKGDLKRQFNDRFNSYITIGGGRLSRRDFHIHRCDCDYIDMLSGGGSSHGDFIIQVCRICRTQKGV